MKQILVKYQNIFLTLYNRLAVKFKPNNSGQALLEYMLILVLISTISFVLLDQVNGKMAEVWVKMIKVISKNPSLPTELI